MAALVRRLNILLCCGRQSTPRPPPVTPGRDESFNNQPSVPYSPAYHRSKWNLLKSEGRLVFKRNDIDLGGLVVLLLLGSPGIGKRSLSNRVSGILSHSIINLTNHYWGCQLTYDDMDGGEIRFWDGYDSAGEYPRYFCGGYDYNLYVTHMTSHYSTLGDHFGIIIAYDISARNSWEEVCRLHNTIDHGLTEGRGTLQILILGLKADLKDTARHVPRAEAETFAKQHNCRYSECSARTGEGVHEAFRIFVEHAYATSIGFEDDLPGLQSRKELGRKAFRDAINTSRAGHTGIPSGGA